MIRYFHLSSYSTVRTIIIYIHVKADELNLYFEQRYAHYISSERLLFNSLILPVAK